MCLSVAVHQLISTFTEEVGVCTIRYFCVLMTGQFIQEVTFHSLFFLLSTAKNEQM